MNAVTRLWTPNSMFTVEQALNDTLAEEGEFDIARVLVIGEYTDNSLMVKPSRMTHSEALWLLARAKNHTMHHQFQKDME